MANKQYVGRGQRCPRCGELTLKARGPGDYAISKEDKTQICSDCGVEEALVEKLLAKIFPKDNKDDD